MANQGSGTQAKVKKSSPVMIALAWLLVGVPLSWGVYNTVLNSQKLFAAQKVAAPAPAPAAATTPATTPAK